VFWVLYTSTVIMVNYCVCVCVIYTYIFNETEIWAYILLASYKVPDILAPPFNNILFLFSWKSPITDFTEITDGRTWRSTYALPAMTRRRLKRLLNFLLISYSKIKICVIISLLADRILIRFSKKICRILLLAT